MKININMMKYFIRTLLITLPCLVHGQQTLLPKMTVNSELLTGLGTNSPFWTFTNQQGRFTTDKTQLLLGMAISNRPVNDTLNYAIHYAVSGMVNNRNTNAWLHEAYVQTKIKMLDITAGKYFVYEGNGDSTLSSGYIMWSGNARAIPRIALGTYNWFTLPFTFNLLEVKAKLEHGWFEKNRYVDNVYLHRKYLIGRIGGHLPLKVSYGIEHNVQWGGVSPEYGQMPSNFDAFMEVFMAKHADTTSALPFIEKYNRVGNHLGTRMAAIEYQHNRLHIKCYNQTIFEDNSGLKKILNPDGIWGLSITGLPWKALNHICVEYIHTTFQSGDTHDPENGQVGRDSYFANGLYKNGWTVNGLTLGTPLITSPLITQSRSPVNNRVEAWHLGMAGMVKGIHYKVLTSITQNSGTYALPLNKAPNYSFLIDLQKNIRQHTLVSVKMGADYGNFYHNNLGVCLVYSRTFSLAHNATHKP